MWYDPLYRWHTEGLQLFESHLFRYTQRLKVKFSECANNAVLNGLSPFQGTDSSVQSCGIQYRVQSIYAGYICSWFWNFLWIIVSYPSRKYLAHTNSQLLYVYLLGIELYDVRRWVSLNWFYHLPLGHARSISSAWEGWQIPAQLAKGERCECGIWGAFPKEAKENEKRKRSFLSFSSSRAWWWSRRSYIPMYIYSNILYL